MTHAMEYLFPSWLKDREDLLRIPGVSDPVPLILLEPLRARAREWLMDQEIEDAPESGPKVPPRAPRI